MPIPLRANMEEAVDALKANRVRAWLTMLGIIIGVMSVVIMLTVGNGARNQILSDIEGFGTNSLIIIPGEEGTNIVSAATLDILDLKDVDALRNSVAAPSLREVASFTAFARVQIQEQGQEEVGIDVAGVSGEYFSISNLELSEGRFWSKADETSRKRIAIIGSEAKDDIYGEDMGPIVGQRISLKGQTYQIVGVLDSRISTLGNVFGDEANTSIFIPTQTAQTLIFGNKNIYGILAEAMSEDRIDAAKEEIVQVLRKEHRLRADKENDFTIQSQGEIVEVLNTVTGVFTLFLAALAAISLLVGGIGIMNIMLVVVAERISEIGLRKSLGAKRMDILAQFLIEAATMTAIGGAIGTGVGLLISYVVTRLGGFAFIVDPLVLLLALSGSAFFGMVFGAYPAYRAAKLDPITALRHE